MKYKIRICAILVHGSHLISCVIELLKFQELYNKFITKLKKLGQF